MDKKEFKDLLLLYGADLNKWPVELKDKALALLAGDSETAIEWAALVEDEVKFEDLLLERSFEEPGEYLASKIIAFAKESANEEVVAEDNKGLLGWLFAEFFTPRVAVALALSLLIGFMAGYMSPKTSLDPFDQLSSEDEVIFEETFSSLFMEGDIFE